MTRQKFQSDEISNSIMTRGQAAESFRKSDIFKLLRRNMIGAFDVTRLWSFPGHGMGCRTLGQVRPAIPAQRFYSANELSPAKI